MSERVAVSGSGGLVGRRVCALLRAAGFTVAPLVRRLPAGSSEIAWDPATGHIDRTALEGLHGVVHLAGESVAGRWTAARKASIRDSRVKGTQLLAQALAQLRRPPAVLVSASAVGYYGDRGDEVLTEASAPGTGFLPETCVAWEAATQAAAAVGIRVVCMRIGLVLSREGGALQKMLPTFRLGLGGRLGGGGQYLSWISREDVARLFVFALQTSTVRGAVNAVAPAPVTNADFTRTLGRVLRRPTLLRVPGVAISLLLGEMGRALLLSSTRVVPSVARAAGFAFRAESLENALRSELGE